MSKLRLASPPRVVVAIILLTLLTCAPAPATPLPSSLVQLESTATEVLRSYITRSSPTDPRYYANGVWHAADSSIPCWYCFDGAAVGAAALARETGSTSFRAIAVQTMDTAIKHHQTSAGAFENQSDTSNDISTGFFGVDLGITYLELESALNAGTRRFWTSSLARAATYLMKNGNVTWYTNGNINLRQTEVMWLAWDVTGDRKYYQAYQQAYSFTISPPRSRWPGFGLHITKRPTTTTDSDGAGYLAESGGGVPGFDPSYTDVQLDTATDLYVLTHDLRYLRLMNLLYNQLQPRLSTGWELNATHGTRKDDDVPFMSAAVSVLAGSGSRPGLTRDVSTQLSLVRTTYVDAMGYTQPNIYKGFETWIAMPLLYHDFPEGLARTELPMTVPATRGGRLRKTSRKPRRANHQAESRRA